MEIEIYNCNSRWDESKMDYTEFYFIKNKKAILRITIWHNKNYKYPLICNGFTDLPINRLKHHITDLNKIDLYEFVFNGLIDKLFDDNKIEFPNEDLIQCKDIYKELKKYFNNIKAGKGSD